MNKDDDDDTNNETLQRSYDCSLLLDNGQTGILVQKSIFRKIAFRYLRINARCELELDRIV